LESPLSGKPCVYYKFKVEECRGSGRGARWVTIVDDEKYKKFEINDGSGYAIIDMNDSELNFKTDRKTRSGFLEKATPEMEKALQKYGKSKDGWMFEKTIKYKETFLEEGDELYVLGEVNDFENYKPIFNNI